MSVLEISEDLSGAAASVQLQATPDASPNPKRKGRPSKGATPAELASVMAQIVGGASTLLAMWLDAEEVQMEPEEARAIGDPAARLLAKQKWAAKITKQLVDASDAIELILALAGYGLRVKPLIAAKLAERAAQHGNTRLNVQPPAPVRQDRRQSPQQSGPAVPATAQPSVEIPGGNGFRFAGSAGFGAESPYDYGFPS